MKKGGAVPFVTAAAHAFLLRDLKWIKTTLLYGWLFSFGHAPFWLCGFL
jgi:hypothetical protein